MARPTKYTPEREKKIVDALRIGCSRRDAYESAGIDQETFARWLKRFAGFAALVREAESAAAVAHTANIAKAAKRGQWKASLEWLKRRRREEWGDSIQADITSKGKAIGDIFTGLSDEDLDERLARAQGRKAPEIVPPES